VQLGVMLFLMAAGLTLVFGIMNLVNFAHGSFYMGGVPRHLLRPGTGSWLLGVALGLAGTLVVGVVVEMVVVRSCTSATISTRCSPLRADLFFNELAAMLWGRAALYTNIPRISCPGTSSCCRPALPAVPPGHHRGSG